MEEYEDHDHSYEEIHEGHEHNVDPHIWTNPVFAKEMAIKICDALCGIDPENEEYYRGNLDEVILKLENLDSEFRNIVSESKDKFIVFGGRFAFYYFVEEYGISYVSAYESCSSEAEPSAAKISEIIKTVKDRGIKTIYYEELTTGKVADIICEETGAEKVILHSCHNISSEDFNSGLSYFDIMEQNAVNLRKGLN